EVAAVAIDDAAGDGNGFADPGETLHLTVTLSNAWRGAGKTAASPAAVLSTSTPGVTISDAASSYPTIAPQGVAAGDPFTFMMGPGGACGGSLHFSLQVSSSLGMVTLPFSVRLGRPLGPGTPVTFTRSIAGGLAIPENSPTGVTDTLHLADDLPIEDLNLRI